MPYFYATVVLHGATEQDYKDVGKLMNEEGYAADFVTGSNKYFMPDGMFWKSSEQTLVEEEAAVERALDKSRFLIGVGKGTRGTCAYFVVGPSEDDKHAGLRHRKSMPNSRIKFAPKTK